MMSSPLEQQIGRLNEIERVNAPKELFFQGEVALLTRRPRIAVVGARKVSSEGARRARALSRELVRRGAILVSGLAEGVDTTIHETAIELGGRTIGVIATPLSEVYPAKNRDLQTTIGREHLLVSQFPESHRIQKQNFPLRDRTMALLSEVTIIVEARDQSGTLYTGREALRLGRPLFILESAVQDKTLSWPHEFIERGARILSRSNISEVFDVMLQGKGKG